MEVNGFPLKAFIDSGAQVGGLASKGAVFGPGRGTGGQVLMSGGVLGCCCLDWLLLASPAMPAPNSPAPSLPSPSRR